MLHAEFVEVSCSAHLQQRLVAVKGNVVDVAVNHQRKEIEDQGRVLAENEETVEAVRPMDSESKG